MADMKIGAYICKGCGLGERLDIPQLENVAQKEGKAQVVKSHDFLCSAAGVELIKNDIANDGVNHVVIAACSRRSKTDAFRFDGVALSRANLREGVIWVRPASDDDKEKELTQEMANDMVRMGCAEIKKMQLPEVNPNHGNNKRILVVGGGISGLTAALEAAKTGYEALLVEKSSALGG
ncbi:MAG: FAD-dependent oxidoreductase, partial [Pseudomonadota bacterium]